MVADKWRVLGNKAQVLRIREEWEFLKEVHDDEEQLYTTRNRATMHGMKPVGGLVCHIYSPSKGSYNK